MNVPGESTLRRDFIRLQQENKERSEALRRQQLLQEQQLREQEEYKRQLLAERQKRIEQQKEQRRRLEEVGGRDGGVVLMVIWDGWMVVWYGWMDGWMEQCETGETPKWANLREPEDRKSVV